MLGSVNLTSPHAVTNKQFSKTLAAALKRPPIPCISLSLLIGQRADLLLISQNVAPEKLIEEGFTFEFDTLESALADLLH